MKKKSHWGDAPSCLLFFLLCSFYQTSAQNVIAKSVVASSGHTVPFLQHKPPKHDLTGLTRRYPMIIFLHGIGERSNDTRIAPAPGPGVTPPPVWNLTGYGPLRQVLYTGLLAVPWNGKIDSFIVLQPMLGEVGGWNNSYIDAMVNYGLDSLKADENRIYLTGHSLGGAGIFNYLNGSAANATKLAAAVPISAGPITPITTNGATYIANAKLPFWGFHANDDWVAVSNTTNAVSKILSANPAVTPRQTIWPNGFIVTDAHSDAPKYVYNLWQHPYLEDSIINIYEWFMGQNNDSLTANILPTASGKDTTVSPTPGTATLDASASFDVNGRIARYVWKKLSAPAGVSLSSITITKPLDTVSSTTVSGLTTVGTYTFELIVVDNRVGMKRDTVTVTVATPPPPGGKALQINSTGGRIIAGNITQLQNATSFTVEAYFKFDSTVTDWSDTEATIFRHYISSTDMIKLNVYKPNKSIYFTVANGVNARGATANNVVSHNTWYHIAAVFEGSGATNANRARVYINGVLQPMTFTDTIPTAISGSVPSVIFGGEPSASKLIAIDEVRFWDSVLAPGAITSWKDRALSSCHPNINRLKLYWPLDNDGTPTHALAALGTSYTSPIFYGTYVSSPIQFEAVSCSPGKAVTFAATTGARIIAGAVNELKNSTAFTVEAYFKYDSVATDWSNTDATIFRNYIGSTDMIRLNVYKPNKAIHFTVANGNTAKGYTVNNVVTHNKWHHVAAVFDGSGSTNASRVKIYIDGVLQPLTFTDTIATSVSGSTPSVIFGGEPSASRTTAIDEVRIWETALSHTTINAWRDRLLTSCHPNASQLALYWPLNNDATPTHAAAALGTTYTSPIFYGSYITSDQASIAGSCGSPSILGDYTEPQPMIPASAKWGRVYPNPTAGSLQLEFTAGHSSQVWVTVVDMYGKYVLSKPALVVSGRNTLPVNIGSLRTGHYFITVRQGTQVLGRFKVIKN